MGVDMELVGGKLAGISDGAIVAVYAADDREQQSPVGYLKTHDVTATTAAVTSVAYENLQTPAAISQFPRNATCRIVAHEIGELRVSLSIRDQESSSKDCQG